MWDDLVAALTYTGLPFAHFGWSKAADMSACDHGVYAEDNEKALYANNAHAERVLEGTIDFYSREGTGAAKRNIEAALTLYKIPYRLNSIQYEEDTGFVHYEWVFEVLDRENVSAPMVDPDYEQFEDVTEELLYTHG